MYMYCTEHMLMYVHYIIRSMCSCMCIIRSICLCMSIELRLNGVCHGLYASVYTLDLKIHLVFGKYTQWCQCFVLLETDVDVV